MPDDVISFEDAAQKRDADQPHRTCDLVCLDCRHRWVGVFPAIAHVSDMDCPNCPAKRAVIVADNYYPE